MSRAFLVLLLGLVPVGFALGLVLAPRLASAPPVPAPVCRPSVPELVDPGDAALVLYLGNSLVFDHDWVLPGTLAVNCARQGMLAARLRVSDLPDVRPALIVLGFGTVELMQGKPDATAFAETMAGHIAALRQRFPEAQILLLGVPLTDDVAKGEVAGLNAALGALARTAGVQFAEAGALPSYDGVHLTRAGYIGWQARIVTLVGAR
jgi:hypothetical protein